MPRTIALLLASAVTCLAVTPAVDAASVARPAKKLEKRGIKKAMKANNISSRGLRAIIIHRKNPKYGAACFRTAAGFEGQVFKRVSRLKWRLVTGGSGWTGNKPTRQLLAPCAAAASR